MVDINFIEGGKLIHAFLRRDKFEIPITDELALSLYRDWNSLMSVVEEVEKLFNGGVDVDIFTDGTVITQYRFTDNGKLQEGKEIVRLTNAEIGFDNKLEHTYQAVVEFIKWYNENK